MGMDVYGHAPTQKEGEYFRNNIWWWHPLADYIELVAPDEAAACEHWHSNDGDGLDEDEALALADRLQAEIDSGRCLRYAVSRGAVGNSGTTSVEANALIKAVTLDELVWFHERILQDPAVRLTFVQKCSILTG